MTKTPGLPRMAGFIREHLARADTWLTGGEICNAAVAAGYERTSVYAVISKEFAAGHIVRRARLDHGPGFEYSSAETPAPADAIAAPLERRAIRLVPMPAGEYVGPAVEAPLTSGTFGTRCAPPNRAAGRIEDALAAVLAGSGGHTLDEVLAAVPNGWSRTDVLSGLADGVIGGWIAARVGEERQRYQLLAAPPAVRHDPLVDEFKKYRLRERCEAMEADLTAALREVREYDAPPELVQSLVELRRCASRTVRALSA